MCKKCVFICFLLVLALPPAAAGLPMTGIEPAIGGWQYSPEGKLSTKNDMESADLKKNFGFGRETGFTARLKVDMPLAFPNAHFSAYPFRMKESSRTAFEFGGRKFDGNLDSRMTLNQYDVGLFYGIPYLKNATLDRLNVDAGLNFAFIDAEAEISGAFEGGGNAIATERESLSIVIPQVYLGVQFQPVERFSFEAEAKGITYQNDSSYSLLGRIKATAFGPVFISGGYRYNEFDIEKDGFVVDFSFSGPFFETGISF